MKFMRTLATLIPSFPRLKVATSLPLLAPLLLSLSCASAPASQTASTGAAVESAPGFPGVGTPVELVGDVPFVSLEGPFWVAGTQRLLFSDVVEANAAGAVVYEFNPETRQFTVFPYPGTATSPTSTNGLALDASGNLLACERYNARLVRVSRDGALTSLADGFPTGSPDRKPFNAPNDLAVRADGNIYFTDSDWGTKPGEGHAAMGVYRLSPHGELSRVIELVKPNGVALSPDQGTLYIGSDVQGKVWRLALDASGAAGTPELFIDGAKVPGGFKVPDGICIDDTGNLYVTNNADDISAVLVFDDKGTSLGRIPLPHAPSNCTFGGADRKTLYVTTLHAVYAVPVPTAGRP